VPTPTIDGVTATLEAPAEEVEPEHAATDEQSRPPRPVPASLRPWRDPHPWIGWLLTGVIAVLAGFTRFWALGFPHGKNFDEVYYSVEAQEMLRYGYEDNRGYLFIVHPPLGKWLIAAGEWIQGAIDGNHSSEQYLTNSLGWRIMPAVFGCLGVIMMTRIIRRLTRSNLFGFIGGLLMAMDGMSLVLARTAILDIFLQTFVIAGFGALLLDRDQLRRRLAGLLADGADLTYGVPSLGPRPWRLLGGVLLGLACAVKWSGLSFFVGFAVLSLIWDRAALKAAGVRRPTQAWGLRSVLPSIGSLLLAPIGAYLLTNLGWIVGENGWNRHYSDSHPPSAHIHLPFDINLPITWAWVPGPLRGLGQSIYKAYVFHVGLDKTHPYESNPWNWLGLGRPVDFYYDGSSTRCGASSCSREILLIGTPIMWWAFAPMLLWLGWHWFSTRDWRAAAVWVAFLAGWLVWFYDLKRTMFLFYMAPLVPFLIVGLVLALGVMLGPGISGGAPREAVLRAERRRYWGLAGVSTFLALVIADFVWMWPLYTGALRTYDEWHLHMWLPSWV
jgi:dolichyl-phosphate-mannose--protein O-mannosyl transferase